VRSTLAACCLAIFLVPAAARAQEAASAADTTAQAPPEKTKSQHENRIYFAMWTLHLRDHVMALHNNWAVGLTTHGFFGATFLNSYNRRAYTGGLQRTFFSTDPRPITASFGARLGFITGYDGRLIRLARKTPVLPLIQPYFVLDVEHIGFELSYTWVVMSVAVSYRF